MTDEERREPTHRLRPVRRRHSGNGRLRSHRERRDIAKQRARQPVGRSRG